MCFQNVVLHLYRGGKLHGISRVCSISFHTDLEYCELNWDENCLRPHKNFKSSIIHQRIKRLPLDDISWTIIAHIGMDGYEYIHPIENRTLSVREAARIQDFLMILFLPAI